MGSGWAINITQDDNIIDEVRGHDLNEALEVVHRAYPSAQFDPEPEV